MNHAAGGARQIAAAGRHWLPQLLPYTWPTAASCEHLVLYITTAAATVLSPVVARLLVLTGSPPFGASSNGIKINTHLVVEYESIVAQLTVHNVGLVDLDSVRKFAMCLQFTGLLRCVSDNDIVLLILEISR